MIKFLHCADLHLDSPLSALDLQKAEVRRNEMRASFTSITLYAATNKLDFLLISGDLFDSDYVTKDTIALIKSEFAKIPDCKVIIAPGNHDPYTKQSCYRRADFPDNVYIFDSNELSCFDFPDKNTTIYGWAFTEPSLDFCPAEHFAPENPDRINILAVHADYGTSQSAYCPLPENIAAGCGVDYIALGHIHKFSGINQLGRTYYAYPGCVEGRGFDECGPKGVIIGAIDKSGGQAQLAAKFLPLSKCIYELERLDVTGAETNADVCEKISSLIAERHYDDKTALRLILTGNVSSGLRLSQSYVTAQFPRLFTLEVVDETSPMYDAAALRCDPTIRGALYASLADMLEGDDQAQRETAALALRYGLAALSDGDIIDF